MYFLGIDPGMASGAYSLLSDRLKSKKAICDNAPFIGDTKKEIDFGQYARFLSVYKERIIVAGVERVSSMPKQGIASAFRFGGGYYGTLAVLAALDIPYELITPAQWKRYYKLKTGATKEDSRQLAVRMFPDVCLKLKKDSDKAESLLICNYMRRKYLGRL